MTRVKAARAAERGAAKSAAIAGVRESAAAGGESQRDGRRGARGAARAAAARRTRSARSATRLRSRPPAASMSAPPRARIAGSAKRATSRCCTSPRTACSTRRARCIPTSRSRRRLRLAVRLPPSSHVAAIDASPTSSEDDGLLQAWELMALDLRADLVVLSACETARGRVAPGEGLIGLSWALFVAGSPASIVSQWKVESASTAELMQQFHGAGAAHARAAGEAGRRRHACRRPRPCNRPRFRCCAASAIAIRSTGPGSC